LKKVEREREREGGKKRERDSLKIEKTKWTLCNLLTTDKRKTITKDGDRSAGR
jgi:hypothetical protein